MHKDYAKLFLQDDVILRPKFYKWKESSWMLLFTILMAFRNEPVSVIKDDLIAWFTNQ